MTLVLSPPARGAPRALAQALLDEHPGSPADLSRQRVLLGQPAVAADLQQALREEAQARGQSGVLLPVLEPLALAAARAAGRAPASVWRSRRLLVEALQPHRGLLRQLFQEQDPWRLAEALQQLFSELDREALEPPADAAGFEARLRRGYRVRGAAPAALSQEAEVLYRLWGAWCVDLGAERPAAVLAEGLQRLLDHPGPRLEVLGLDAPDALTARWLARGLTSGRLRVWLAGRRDGEDGAGLRDWLARVQGHSDQPLPIEDAAAAPGPRSAWLDRAYASAPMPRAAAGPGLRWLEAADAEAEARLVDYLLREAWLAGSRSLAVVTEDRRLARRLRALLERSGLGLRDEIGWALSTSAAAAAFAALLDLHRHGPGYRRLLDWLQSPCSGVLADPVDAFHEQLVREGVAGGWTALQRAAAAQPALASTLEALQAALEALPAPLRPLPAGEWTGALLGLIEALPGLKAWLAADAAGQALLETLADLHEGLQGCALPLDADGIRALLDRALEAATFRPDREGRVRLLTLEQAQGLEASTVVLAGASRAQLPGAATASPFFNQAVRAELGLPDWRQRQALSLWRLRRLLDASPELLITQSADSAGEAVAVSPWIAALASVCEPPWRLDGETAARVLGPAGDSPARRASLPGRRRPAAPRVPAAQLRRRLSASAHQRLIECPYRYFGIDVLGLAPPREPDEDPDRRDFGERVHRLLQALASPQPGLPPPPPPPWQRPALLGHLEGLAEAVLAADLAQRALAQVWLENLRAALPALADWLLARGPAAVQAEVTWERDWAGWQLQGRVDRVETRASGRAVIDLKAGGLPAKRAVLAGEAVQLAHYALLEPAVERVEYLSLRGDQGPLVVEGSALQGLRETVGGRLTRRLAALERAAPRPAHGEPALCRRCELIGVCRRGEGLGL
ncbi:MAG TPA: PD-(D/E)XK nuclease family protein [Nevskiaceae bacterium]|nr:PD-(D/E)XK nuclease family protein [Nevskiaceae bacterium]